MATYTGPPLNFPDRAIDHYSTGWVDVTAARAFDTTYQNGATARQISFWGTAAGAGTAQVKSDLAGVATIRAETAPVGSFLVNFTVPPNWQYRVAQNGVLTLTKWHEAQL